MTRLLLTIWMLPIMLTLFNSCFADLDVVYEFKYIDYDWKNNKQRTVAINTGIYDFRKIITNDFQPLPDNRILVTTPRYFNNPASLSTITNKNCDRRPLLHPYPDWSWHTPGDCSGITSVSRVFLDDCDRLWIVDSGKIENKQVCSAKILAFDVHTDELIIEFEIPSNLTHSPVDEGRGYLEIQAVETTADSCDTFWVYIADVEGYGILIWDGSEIWRLDDEIFIPTEGAESIEIAGETVILREGPGVMLLTPPGFLEQPYLLWKTLTSFKTFAVTLEDLHNSKSGRGITYYRGQATAPTQEPSKVYSKTGGILFATYAADSAIACWNLQYPLEGESIAVLEENNTTLQYVSSMKITPGSEKRTETLWAMSSRRQKFLLGTMDFTEVNFRVMAVDVARYIDGTVCVPKNHEIAESIVDKYFPYYKTT